MKIRLGHNKQSLLIDTTEVDAVEIVQEGDKIVYVFHDADGWRRIKADNDYAVLRIGDKEKAQKWCKSYLSYKGKPTTWDLVYDFDKAVKELEEAGADTDKLCFFLPAPGGFMAHHGPMTAEEAYKVCKEYWDNYGGKET